MDKSPYDGIRTGKAGLPVDALARWDDIDNGKIIHEYKIPKVEYISGIYSVLTDGTDSDFGWVKP